MQSELDFPFRVDTQGCIAFTSIPEEVLSNHVLIIIGTELGERVMRPDYGVGLSALLFESNDSTTAALIRVDITEALEAYEPGVIVGSVTTDTVGALDGVFNVSVTYSSANSVFSRVIIPVNTAVLHRGGAVQEDNRA